MHPKYEPKSQGSSLNCLQNELEANIMLIPKPDDKKKVRSISFMNVYS